MYRVWFVCRTLRMLYVGNIDGNSKVNTRNESTSNNKATLYVIYYNSIDCSLLYYVATSTIPCITVRNHISSSKFGIHTYNKKTSKVRMQATWFTKKRFGFQFQIYIIRFWRSVGKFVLFYICHICICISTTSYVFRLHLFGFSRQYLSCIRV